MQETKYIKTRDGQIHKLIKVEQVFHYDIYYFNYICDDGEYGEYQVIGVYNTLEEANGGK